MTTAVEQIDQLLHSISTTPTTNTNTNTNTETESKSPEASVASTFNIHTKMTSSTNNNNNNNSNDDGNVVLKSWIKVAPNSHFPIQNLPYGVFHRSDDDTTNTANHIGVAIGAHILDLFATAKCGFFNNTKFLNHGECFLEPTLNAFMALPRGAWLEAREIIQFLLRSSTDLLRDNPDFVSACVVPQSAVDMCLPCRIGDYTDFYSSRNHATNVGIMFRGPENALKPNWTHLPVGYHGRASSVVVSGTQVRRPCGQLKNDPDPAVPPTFGASQRLDIELEVGFFFGGKGNRLGNPIRIADTFEHVFGMVLLNDWSARDIQKWEYIPLGPFNAKNFCTSISPWVVTMLALEPFRLPLPTQTPSLLPYLTNAQDFLIDMDLFVRIQSEQMQTPQLISECNSKFLYYSAQQQLAHHTSTGCPFNAGDLLGSGTISGTEKNQMGSLLEMSWSGKNPITLDDGSQRKFLNDGDRITFTGFKQSSDGSFCLGFGECTGIIIPAHDPTLLGKL